MAYDVQVDQRRDERTDEDRAHHARPYGERDVVFQTSYDMLRSDGRTDAV